MLFRDKFLAKNRNPFGWIISSNRSANIASRLSHAQDTMEQRVTTAKQVRASRMVAFSALVDESRPKQMGIESPEGHVR